MLLFGHCMQPKRQRRGVLYTTKVVSNKRMSGGLMSCVRENSPPLEMDVNVSGPLSLPEPSINNSDLMGSAHSSSHHNIMSSTPLAAQVSSTSQAESAGFTPTATPPNTEQTKRRRFHPLRNLRRIFRRRTITTTSTTAADTTPCTLAGTTASSNSEKNLRSATLSSITSVASASSPSSPLTHQQLEDAYLTQSLPKSKSAHGSFLSGGKKNQSHNYNLNTETKTKSKHKHKNQKHQQQSKELIDFERHQQQTEVEDMFGTTTQASASYHHHNVHKSSTTAAVGTKASFLSQRQSMGVAVFPGAINRSFFTERQKLRSVGDSSQDLDSGSGNDSGTGGGHNSSATERVKSGGSASGGEMSDSQRSLSEGRLVDSDYSREGLSQSHDSVFSESATASSLSIVLKAELADVLRKRRNRPDASDEDLGLPRSPASPQRRAANLLNHATPGGPPSAGNKSIMGEKHSEVSSLSLLSMNSNDGEEFLTNSTATTANNLSEIDIVQERSTVNRYSRPSTMSNISTSSDILRHRDSSFNDAKDEVDLFSSDWQRLSHSAAKHKMAIRPTKKKGGPSRQHRRTLETSIPEANEDLNKQANKQVMDVQDSDTKSKTRSLPPGVNAAKRVDETQLSHTANKEPIIKTTKISISSTTQSTNSTNSTANTAAVSSTTNIFGLRNLTAKATAMFESKDTLQVEEVSKKNEKFKKSEVLDKSTQPTETTETGFLRRLMHRNSKRSIAKANAGEEDQDELDKKQNEPKKMQMSSMVPNTNNLFEKSKCEIVTYEQTLGEKRKDVKRENLPEGKPVIFTAIPNNYVKDERKIDEKSPSKPKSGPAARQRYLPQNISSEDLVKTNDEKAISKESILSKSLIDETFLSTSLIKQITKQQSSVSSTPIKMEHHFEKNIKTAGLSAFQQKVSRSNDSFARPSSINLSMVSLDKSDDEIISPRRVHAYEQKQRKSVEKSRSFRTYEEQKDNVSSATVHNNMPSLPDLSLNLKVSFYKDFVINEKEYFSPSPPELFDEKHASLGFEINDNKLVKPESESRKSFSNYDKNIILTTSTHGSTASKSTPTKLLNPATVVTPFTNSSSSMCNKNISEIENNIDLIVKSPFVSVIRKSINLNEEQANEVVNLSATYGQSTEKEKARPKILPLKKEKSLSEENVLHSPSTATVTLRDKTMVKTNTFYSSALETQTKEFGRKSVPAFNNKPSNGFRCNSTRRSTSMAESSEQNVHSMVPEFMKIQLNRVDPTRTSESRVILAKNIKEPSLVVVSRESSPEKRISSSSMDDLSFRRLSSESVDINERASPGTEKRFSGFYHEAINKQPKICTGLPPKSPAKKTPTTPTTPPTPTINERDSIREHFKLAESLENNNIMTECKTNSLSLQERRRLFMNEDRSKAEKKMEEVRYERKKLFSEETSKTSGFKEESEHKEAINKDKDLSPLESNVILRKKSFASSVHSLNGNSLNNSNSSTSIGSNNNIGSNKDDATPELMKVFARRSLKIKDEDLDKILNINGNNSLSATQTLKKFNSPCSNPNVDSDKENQSASDEKLDKLNKLETIQTKNHNSQLHTVSSNGTVGSSNNNNRNSLADFRLGGCKMSHSALAINNNNGNNSNSPSNGETNSTSSLAQNKSFLPPIKITGGYRAMSIERNNNSQNNALSPSKISTTLDRSSIKLGDLSTSSSTDCPITISKTIERSATMGEFKGIHQRRAEWEKRAKEALK